MREYWTHQWAEINPRVELIGFKTLPDGRVRVRIAQTVSDLQGNLLFDGEVEHIYTLTSSLVSQMEIQPSS